MEMPDVYNVAIINSNKANVDLKLTNVVTGKDLFVRLNTTIPLRKIKPIIAVLKETETDIVQCDSVYYNYAFNELHNGLLGDPIQLASMSAEHLLITDKGISIPAQLQQIYEYDEID